jgi:hypothetical protein
MSKSQKVICFDVGMRAACLSAAGWRKRLRSGEKGGRARGVAQVDRRRKNGNGENRRIGSDKKKPAMLGIVDMWFLFYVLRAILQENLCC